MNVVRRVREAVGSRWFSLGLQVAALEAFLLVAASLSWHFHAVSPPLVLGYGLIVVAAGSILLSPRWPVGAVGVALAAVLASHLLDYAASPIDLALMVALFKAASPEHARRTVLLGIVTVLGYVVVQLISTGTISLNTLAIGTLTVSTFLVLGFAVASQRAFGRQRREEEMQRRVTDERLRIARELHDVVSHSISTINVQAGMAAHVIDHKPDEAKAALVTIKQTSRDTLRELRGILNVLRQVDEGESRQPAPGLAQLDVLVDTAVRAGVPVSASVGGLTRALPPAVDLAAYRIIQESLTNVIRHAGRASAQISVDFEPDRVVIEVSDDGRGTGVPDANGWPEGHGLAGMRERAAAVRGELQAGPRPGHGFQVRAALPTNGAIS
ncbi:MAG: sensor histidine kinase [Chloroflexi bacterium]|nr:MAG: sensor histidine kinase [Chloroflexota bacterium]